MHVQSRYAIDLPEARRVVSEHGLARVDGLRATYGFFADRRVPAPLMRRLSLARP